MNADEAVSMLDMLTDELRKADAVYEAACRWATLDAPTEAHVARGNAHYHRNACEMRLREAASDAAPALLAEVKRLRAKEAKSAQP